MEKNGKEPQTNTHCSNLVIKVLLVVLCMVVVAQFALFANNFASLKALNNRLNALEEQKSSGLKPWRSEKHEHGTRRSKRSIDEKEFKKAMGKLEKLEGR